MNGPEVIRAGAAEPGEVAARAASVVCAGGLLVMPTDTVYGLAAALDSPCALDHIYEAKARPRDMALPVLLSSIDAAAPLLAEPLSAGARSLAERFWPGALTMIVRASAAVPERVTAGLGTVGLRVPDSAVAREIIAAAGGALAVTSANLSGAESPRDVDAVPPELLAHVSLIVDAGPCPVGVPSTVVDLTGPEPRVLREGAVPAALVLEALGL